MNASHVSSRIDHRGVATIRLNNPEKHNAFDDVIVAALTEVFSALDSDVTVRVIVLAASGKSFCAGADLNWMQRMAAYDKAQNLADAQALATMLYTLNNLTKPTIARVQGAAFGGGVGLFSCCDMAVATPSAVFGLSEVKLGMVPATISPYVIDAIGARAARRYFTTAERFTADTALRLGLISEVVTAAELDNTLNNMINALLGNGPKAITAAKQLIATIKHQAIDQRLINETSQLIASIRSSAEGKEGLNAFLEKRAANWAPEQL